MSELGLAYIGKILFIEPILNAEFIECATVVCGRGGKWRGVVKKGDFKDGDICTVYLPDAIVVACEEMMFLKDSGWRVRMRRFLGAPSEVVITPITTAASLGAACIVGEDCTQLLGVKKYFKPLPASLNGKMVAGFPAFVPKTDELNYQTSEDLVQSLCGKDYYITEKLDGSSTTAFKYKGHFGVCSRNWEIEADETNGYWEVAYRYKLPETLLEGFAIQWETVGPKIQTNSLGLHQVDGFAFSAYNIEEHRYLTYDELVTFCNRLNFPMVNVILVDDDFQHEGVEWLGEGTYQNGKPREGVVVRSVDNLLGHKPISFKVINLNYEK